MEDLSQDQIDMVSFFARRMGHDCYLFAGYDSKEFEKHVLSKGLYDSGGPKIAMSGSVAGMAYIIGCILTQFDFSYNLRRAVTSIINTVETGRMIRNGKKDPEGTE